LHYNGLTQFGEWIFKGNLPTNPHQFAAPTHVILENLENKMLAALPSSHDLDYEVLVNGIKK